MERLTTNKDVSEMGMVELAHNSCYVKDYAARYRDFEEDMDARLLARKLLKDFAGGDDSFTCDEDFEEYITACLEDGFESIEGLIALFYRNLWAMADLHARLKRLEDLKDSGRLLELPCAVGDTVYFVRKCKAPNCKMCGGYKWLGNCYTDYKCRIFTEMFLYRHLEELGKTVFLTLKAAEEALERMVDGNEID